MNAVVSNTQLIPRYVRSTYTGEHEDDGIYDVIWTDRATGREILNYDGADPANWNPAYGGQSDKDWFTEHGLDINEGIELSQVAGHLRARIDFEQEAGKFERKQERVRKIAKLESEACVLFEYLQRHLGAEVTQQFAFENYYEGERLILQPALERLGFNSVSFCDGERDSFGPLSRKVVAHHPTNGGERWFYYG